jgi:hypothetical protein
MDKDQEAEASQYQNPVGAPGTTVSSPSKNASAPRPLPTLLSHGQGNKRLVLSDYLSSSVGLSTHPDWDTKGRRFGMTRTFRYRRG